MTNARQRTPRAVAGPANVRNARLTPTDGFVLSRVDGLLSEAELVTSSGLPAAELDASLSKLESLGLITFEAPTAQPSPKVSPSGTPESARSPHSQRGSIAPATGVPTPAPRTGPIGVEAALDDADALALAEDVDLDIELRRQLLTLHRSLNQRDHYALLGIERTADKKGVKRAYYELAAKFHPDKHFRKRLGSFKARLEVIFARLTLAHDTLAAKDRRAEYDAYVDEQRRLRGIEQSLADAANEVLRAEESVQRAAQTDEVSAKAQETPANGAVGSPANPVVETAARRDAFARRLLGLRAGKGDTLPPARVTSIPPPASQLTASEAMGALRQRYEDRVARGRQLEARKYAAMAEQSLLADQIVTAANSYRIAVGLAPGDLELERKARETQAKANVLLGDTYARQAQYEEKSAQWPEAARSWVRACKVRPADALTHDRAACALLRSGGDLHEAARLATRACELEPADPSHRVTLSNVFLAAGLVQNARRELLTASRLAPHDGTIEAMVKRLGDIT